MIDDVEDEFEIIKTIFNCSSTWIAWMLREIRTQNFPFRAPRLPYTIAHLVRKFYFMAEWISHPQITTESPWKEAINIRIDLDIFCFLGKNFSSRQRRYGGRDAEIMWTQNRYYEELVFLSFDLKNRRKKCSEPDLNGKLWLHKFPFISLAYFAINYAFSPSTSLPRSGS